MKEAHQQLTNWMTAAGLTVRLDAAGNLIGATSGSTDRPVVMLGSHLDTVVNAGRFDGILGVLLGLAVVEVLRDDSTDVDLPFDVHVVAFSDEEGVRYQMPFIGSMGIAGCLESNCLGKLDANQVSLAKALNQFGCPDDVESASYGKRNVVAFFETHIEQAVALQEW